MRHKHFMCVVCKKTWKIVEASKEFESELVTTLCGSRACTVVMLKARAGLEPTKSLYQMYLNEVHRER